MGRPRNPLADPVKVQKRDGKFGVRYYPTGIVDPSAERKWLPDRWDLTPDGRAKAEEIAAQLRQQLMEHRAAHGIVHASTAGIVVSNRVAVRGFIAQLPPKPKGTLKARETQLKTSLVDAYGDRPVTELGVLAETIVEGVVTGAHQRTGELLSESTRFGRIDALSLFGRWVATTYQISDPFGALCEVARKASGTKRSKAEARVHRDDPFDDDERDTINPDRLPTYQAILAARDALVTRETSGPPGRKSAGRGSKGGAPVLSLDVAEQFAENLTFAASSGLRQCEVLVAHTSRIRLDDMIIKVDRQLDRYSRWEPGKEPPLVPPKHDIERTVQIWPSYHDKLAKLIAYADEYTRGYLFAPTRGQTNWATGLTGAIDRAEEQMRWSRQLVADNGGDAETVLVWDYKYHWLRHFYASHSLASKDAGGLGWSLTFVQRCLGHQSPETTQRVYRHITNQEYKVARLVAHDWPGL